MNEQETLQAVVKSVSLDELEQTLSKCKQWVNKDEAEGQTALRIIIGAIVLKQQQCLVQLRLFE